jgi:hypothetical protein
MAKNRKMSVAAVNAEADALAALCNGGYLRIYDGLQPATADTVIAGQKLLAELRFGSPAFASAADGLITANAITKDSAADDTGTATWFRALGGDGTTVVFDDSVGTADAGLILDSVSIAAGADVSVTLLTHRVTKG